MHHHTDWGILYLSTAPEERGGGEVRRRENIEKGKREKRELRKKEEGRREKEGRGRRRREEREEREGRKKKEGERRKERGGNGTCLCTCTMVEAGLSLYLMVTGMRLLHSLCITDVSFNSVRTGRPE